MAEKWKRIWNLACVSFLRLDTNIFPSSPACSRYLVSRLRGLEDIGKVILSIRSAYRAISKSFVVELCVHRVANYDAA